MPRRAFKKSRFRRKRFIFRRRGFKRSALRKKLRLRTKRVGFFTADRLQVKLRYQTIANITAALSGDVYVFSGNAPFDPDETFVGHQPTAWDQYAALYKRYYVAGSKISVELNNLDQDNALICTIWPSPEAFSLGGLATTIPWENKNSRNTWCGPRDSGNAGRMIKYYMTTKKIYERPGTKLADDFQSLTSTTPSNEWFWNVVTQTSGGTADINWHGKIQLTYYVTFYDRKVIAAS